MHQTEQFIQALRRSSLDLQEVDFKQRGYHAEVQLTSDNLRTFAEIMLAEEYFLVFVSAVHVAPAIEMIYQFAHFNSRSRIVGRLPLGDDVSVPTISDIFQGANWHEREAKDFFGIVFRDHPNLEPLVLPEGSEELKPLLKAADKLKNKQDVSWQPPVEAEAEAGETVKPANPEKS